MPEVAKKKRTWLGLVCPVCRFVFRVPKDHEGQGVICPACNHLLNLPEDKMSRKPVAQKSAEKKAEVVVEEPKVVIPKPREVRESKPIVARALTEDDKIKEAPSDRKRRKGRRRKSSEGAVGWDQKESNKVRKDETSMPWIIGGGLLGLVVAGVGAWLVIDSAKKDENKNSEPPSQLPSFTLSDLEDESKVELTEEEKKRQKEIRDSVKTGMNVLSDAEESVKKFLNAGSLEEMAKYVRTPEVTVPRMREWYGSKVWEPIGVKEVGAGGRVTVKGRMASMSVQLKDFTYRQVALERVGSEYKVDWESWIVWSSIPWEDIFEKKPKQAIEIRVRCSQDSYYNRHFRDDGKWLAVKLLHPLEDRTLYGYIDKDSPALTRLIADLQGGKVSAATIKVKFPKDSLANNQVEITEYIQNGWVRPSADDESTQPE